MGTVYLARDVKLGRVVAIKVVSPEAVSGIGTKQFLKETRYTARLQHPHILTLYDADELARKPYLQSDPAGRPKRAAQIIHLQPGVMSAPWWSAAARSV